MSRFSINAEKLNTAISGMGNIESILINIGLDIYNVRRNLHIGSDMDSKLRSDISLIENAISDTGKKIEMAKNALVQIENKYLQTEKQVLKRYVAKTGTVMAFGAGRGGGGFRGDDKLFSMSHTLKKDNSRYIDGDTEFKKSWSVFGVEGEGDIDWDINYKSKDKEQLNEDGTIGEKDTKGFNLSEKLTSKIGLYAVKGKVSAESGIAKLSAAGSMMAVEAKGTGEARIFKDGKFEPGLYVDAKAKAHVAKGSIEGSLGTDRYKATGKVTGTVLGAEAAANAGLGWVKDEKTGNTEFKASAKASAMAYTAKGEVEGAISILGIKLGAKVTGYAGAAGAEASVGIEGKKAKAGLGLAGGVGGSLELSIDFSEFKLPKFSETRIGSFIGGLFSGGG